MQFLYNFVRLAIFVLALSSAYKATPLAALGSEDETLSVAANEPASYITSYEKMMYWIANTHAKLTFIGEPLNPLTPRSSAQFTRTVVIYCSRRDDNQCTGECRVYIGGSACLEAPGTECISATKDIGFCTRSRCTGTCNTLSTCRTPLDNGFCFTPSTSSIAIAA